jgi:hypothetical protein
MQMSGFGDKRKGIVTCLDAFEGRCCLSAEEAAHQWWDEELAARLQDESDVTTTWHCELNTVLVKVEVMIVDTSIFAWSSHKSFPKIR